MSGHTSASVSNTNTPTITGLPAPASQPVVANIRSEVRRTMSVGSNSSLAAAQPPIPLSGNSSTLAASTGAQKIGAGQYGKAPAASGQGPGGNKTAPVASYAAALKLGGHVNEDQKQSFTYDQQASRSMDQHLHQSQNSPLMFYSGAQQGENLVRPNRALSEPIVGYDSPGSLLSNEMIDISSYIQGKTTTNPSRSSSMHSGAVSPVLSLYQTEGNSGSGGFGNTMQNSHSNSSLANIAWLSSPLSSQFDTGLDISGTPMNLSLPPPITSVGSTSTGYTTSSDVFSSQGGMLDQNAFYQNKPLSGSYGYISSPGGTKTFLQGNSNQQSQNQHQQQPIGDGVIPSQEAWMAMVGGPFHSTGYSQGDFQDSQQGYFSLLNDQNTWSINNASRQGLLQGITEQNSSSSSLFGLDQQPFKRSNSREEAPVNRLQFGDSLSGFNMPAFPNNSNSSLGSLSNNGGYNSGF